ncbi:hypothetical protein QP173_02425 [Aerococcus urinae]|uniref:hypothetical protein n=1 Tax=Aerococcus TaxID=1375 RepID=UPI0018A75F5B|nr:MULTISPECIES: hypothetical protein [Aerococcus]MCY3036229.1 hypothetical protein [Aerococcus sp. Group 2]MDK6520243.1 hypothetical protein [Aerococcus urinae]
MADENKNLKDNQYVGDDGKVYETVEVKPWYKKWYLWVIFALVLLLFIPMYPVSHPADNSQENMASEESIPSESSSNTEAQENNSSQDSSQANKQIYSAGEEVMLTDGNNNVSITINSASADPNKLPSYMHGSDFVDSSRIVMIDLSYKNYDLPENFRVSTHELQVYDEDGHGLERISQQNGQDEVGQGRSADSQVYFYYDNPEEKPETIQVDYVPMGSSDSVVTIEVDVEQWIRNI